MILVYRNMKHNVDNGGGSIGDGASSTISANGLRSVVYLYQAHVAACC